VRWRLDIREEALLDIEIAADWYEQRELGLGSDFARTVRVAIRRLPENPRAYRLRDRRRQIYWFLPPRFPYRIFYRLSDDLTTMFAVIHAARHDRHWKRRI
jgi:plasmid stabilization system protein ParE